MKWSTHNKVKLLVCCLSVLSISCVNKENTESKIQIKLIGNSSGYEADNYHAIAQIDNPGNIYSMSWQYSFRDETVTLSSTNDTVDFKLPLVDISDTLILTLNIYDQFGESYKKDIAVTVNDPEKHYYISSFDQHIRRKFFDYPEDIANVSIRENDLAKHIEFENGEIIINNSPEFASKASIQDLIEIEYDVLLKSGDSISSDFNLTFYPIEVNTPPGDYTSSQHISFNKPSNVDIYIKFANEFVLAPEQTIIENSLEIETYAKKGNYRSDTKTLDYGINRTLKIIDNPGTTLWLNQPSAIRYRGKYDRTYFTWLSDRVIKITYFDHQEKQWGNEQIIHSWERLDDHSAASILIPTEGIYAGKIFLFYSLHNSELYMSKTTNSEDITEWEQKIIISESQVTYPQPVYLGSNIISIFYRAKYSQTPTRIEELRMINSEDGGELWSKERAIVHFGEGTWIYSVLPQFQDGKLHLSWNIYDANQRKYRDIYYAFSTDLGKTWQGQGEASSNLLNSQNSKLIFDSSNYSHCRLWDMKISPTQKTPAFTFVLENDTDKTHYRGKYATLEGENVATYDIAPIRNNYYSDGVILNPSFTDIVYISNMDMCGTECISAMQFNSENKQWTEVYRLENDIHLPISRHQFIAGSPVESHALTWENIYSYTKWTQFNTSLATNIDAKGW